MIPPHKKLGNTHGVLDTAKLTLNLHANIVEQKFSNEQITRVREGEVVEGQSPVLGTSNSGLIT